LSKVPFAAIINCILESQRPGAVTLDEVHMGKKDMSVEEQITTTQAAEILGLSVRQTRQHAVNGSLPGKRLGRDWIFNRSDVLAVVGKLPQRGKYERKPV